MALSLALSPISFNAPMAPAVHNVRGSTARMETLSDLKASFDARVSVARRRKMSEGDVRGLLRTRRLRRKIWVVEVEVGTTWRCLKLPSRNR
eukprot:scaffold66262_cov29-Tisochrysis_lutea.AAC.5